MPFKFRLGLGGSVSTSAILGVKGGGDGGETGRSRCLGLIGCGDTGSGDLDLVDERDRDLDFVLRYGRTLGT